MSARAKEWAIKARIALLSQLGAVCGECGELDNLTFDCIYPQGDGHHRGSTDQRMSFYRRQFLNGNLQVLCDRCNGRKGVTTDKELVPF